MGLGGGKMTRATGTSTKTTRPSRAGVKTGMTMPQGHGSWERPEQMPASEGRDRSLVTQLR